MSVTPASAHRRPSCVITAHFVDPGLVTLWTVFGPRAYLRHIKRVRGDLATGVHDDVAG